MHAREPINQDPGGLICIPNGYARHYGVVPEKADCQPERIVASNPAGVDPRCPLCRSGRGERLASLPYEQIWLRLREDWGASFSAAVRKRHTPGPDLTVYRCVTCGLDYFSPAVPGDAEFYTELMRAVPYDEARWEFSVVSQLVGGSQSLVDFGSGTGAFLRLVRQRVGRVVGLDYNRQAIDVLRASGLEAYEDDFAEFAARERGAFDVACAFQLIEHLPEVDMLMRPMVECTRPGGRLFISLPNRDRQGADPETPLDCPPHHSSRWGARQLEALAERFALRLVDVRFAPLTYSEATLLCLAPVDRVLPAERSSATSTRVIRSLVRRAVIGPRRYELAARAGLFARRGLHGHTMLAELQVLAPASGATSPPARDGGESA